jgi:trimeric autotransporter adhesin
MKKVILTGIALMAFAAAGFAQNTSTLNQNGNSQTGNVVQTGNLLISNIQQTSAGAIINQGNYAATSQKPGFTQPANKDEAYINQVGNKSGFASIGQEGGAAGKNVATINQKNNTGGSGTTITAASAPGAPLAQGNTPNPAGIAAVKAAGGNYANGYQQGHNQTLTISQNDGSAGNYADVRQDNYGTGQTATINQNNVSTNNSATTNQFGDANALTVSQSNKSSDNKATVRQGFSGAVGGPNSFNAVATVEQNGTGINASTDNTATVAQNGVFVGTATIRQNAGVDGDSKFNKGTINQIGNSDVGTINQNNRSNNNEATLTQAGFGGHTATVNQNGSPTGVSSTNKAVVGQTGVLNQATVNQLGIDINAGGVGNSNNNQAFVTQAGQNNKAFVNQNDGSFSNVATVNQAGGGAGDLATIDQNTNAYTNAATINQGSLSTGGNTASVLQQNTFSNGGTATINQNTTIGGGGNVGALVQGTPGAGTQSNGNAATLSQQGSFNQARLEQIDDLNTASITQTGNYNIVRNVSGAVGSFAVQNGTSNTLTITQTSPGGAGLVGNIANVSQIGNNNGSVITQTTN